MVTNSSEYMKEYRAKHPEYVQRFREYQKEYNKTHPEQKKLWDDVSQINLKLSVLTHYCKGAPKCQKCGESNLRKLCLDHINEDGNEHRKTVSSGKQIYLWVKRNNYPEFLQVLCYKCNYQKYIKHKQENGVLGEAPTDLFSEKAEPKNEEF